MALKGEEGLNGTALLEWYKFMYRIFFKWNYALLGRFFFFHAFIDCIQFKKVYEAMAIVARPCNNLSRSIVNGVPVLYILATFGRPKNCPPMELVIIIFTFSVKLFLVN
jgi:hypothetical protein